MAGVSERVLPHLESLRPNELLDNARNLEQIDRIARRARSGWKISRPQTAGSIPPFWRIRRWFRWLLV